MRPSRRVLARVWRGAVGVVLAGVMVTGATAAEGTPVALPTVPDPAACTGAARTVDELTALFASATPSTMDLEPASVSVEIGTAADQATIDSVANVVYGAMACLNSGDFGRFFGLMTDHCIVTYFPWITEAIASGDVPEITDGGGPLPADMAQTLLAVGGVTVLADGRVGATVILHDPASDSLGNEVLHLTFTPVDGAWLIDEVAELD